MNAGTREPGAPGSASGNAVETDAARRVGWLFRESIRGGQAHPLLSVVARRLGADPRQAAIPPATGPRPVQPDPKAPRITVDELRERVRTLPSLPAAVLDLLAALRDDGRPVAELAGRVGHDPALAARTLRVANSSFYGVPGRVGTLEEAFGVLGLRTVVTLVGAAALTRSLSPPDCEGFDFQAHWRHSIVVAGLARRLAPIAGVDADIAFTAGLLHDIGRLALATTAPVATAAAIREAGRSGQPLREVEAVVIGCDHVAAGLALAAHWHLPAALAAAMAGHHAPAGSPRGGTGDETAALCDVTHLADALAHAGTRGTDPLEHVPPVDLGAWQRLGLDGDRCHDLLESADRDIDGLCEAFQR